MNTEYPLTGREARIALMTEPPGTIIEDNEEFRFNLDTDGNIQFCSHKRGVWKQTTRLPSLKPCYGYRVIPLPTPEPAPKPDLKKVQIGKTIDYAVNKVYADKLRAIVERSKGEPPKPVAFWMVYAESKRAPVAKHDSEIAANEEAARIAWKESVTTHVLQRVASFVHTVTVTKEEYPR